MNPEVSAAQAESLSHWATHYDNDETPGAKEVAFMLRRASAAIQLMLKGEPVVFEEQPRDIALQAPRGEEHPGP